jgi:hypothetical protein
MNNVSFFVNELDGVEYAIIDNGDDSFNSMPKSIYNEMIAAQQNAPAFPVTPPTEQTLKGEE